MQGRRQNDNQLERKKEGKIINNKNTGKRA